MGFESYVLESNGVEQGSKLDLSRYVSALKRRWWLVLLVSILVSVPWAFYVKQEKPVYEATASIRFRNLTTRQPEALMEDIYERLTSRSFTEQVVREMGLVASIEQHPDSQLFIRRSQIFSRFTSSSDPEPGKYILRIDNNATFRLIHVDDETEKEVTIRTGDFYRAALDTINANGFAFQLASTNPADFPKEVAFTVSLFRSAVKSLQSRIEVELNRSWTTMMVTLQDYDPFVVAQTVNSLAQVYINESIEVSHDTKSTQLQILANQVERAKADFNDVDRRLTEARRTKRFGGEGAFQNVYQKHGAAEDELERLKEQRESLQELLDKLAATNTEGPDASLRQQRESKRYVYVAIAEHGVFANDPSMSVTRQRLKDLDRRWESEIAIKSESHPDVVKLQNQIDQIYAQVVGDANRKLNSLARDVTKKQSEVGRLAAEIQSVPGEQSEIAELAQEYAQKSTYYQSLQSQYQQAQITGAAEKPSIEILDRALEPEYPVNRDKKKKAAAGGAVGFLLGLGVVIGLEALDRTIKSVDDVKSSMKQTVLGAIPQIDFDELGEFQDSNKAKAVDQQLVTHDYAPTPIGEAYRSLRTNIMFSKAAGRIQTLVITSTAPGDGKSFTAANLSITMAQQKSSTLLVDTDLRRGVLHNTFGVPKEPGFSNYLSNQVLPMEIINETHIPNLSMISCGSLVPNPSELLGSTQLRRFLDEMRRKFDIIIFDTPPLNAATDAVVLGTQVDGTVVVVRASKTKKEVARTKMEMFQHVQAKVIGVILNGTAVDLAHEGYSYYHY